MPMRRDWVPAFRWLQIMLIVGAIALDFAHGIRLGEHDIGFHPIYRFRQTLAVAISRLHQPALHGYLADQSVINALTSAGFPRLPEEGGHADLSDWTALFANSAALDRAIQQGLDAQFDPTLPPQTINGNEVAYADYFVIAFRLFGPHLTSLYYLFFAILCVSCILFYLQFRHSPFSLFLLTSYLAGIFFLQNYVHSQNAEWGATLTNSRFFEALSLLPASHVFLVIWRREKPSLITVATVILQSMILAFLIDCRITARWQLAAITAASVLMVLVLKWESGDWWTLRARDQWKVVWPAVAAVVALAGHMSLISHAVDARYASQPKYHPIWHEVLRGLMGSSSALQKAYIGRFTTLGAASDQDAYDAVSYDLTERWDTSSPIAVVRGGRVEADVTRGWSEYERLARRLVIQIVLKHPKTVLYGLYNKGIEQISEYRDQDAMSFENLRVAGLIAALGAIIWLAMGGVGSRHLLGGAYGAAVMLLAALAPPIIAPSALSVGTLLAYLMAFVLAACAILILVGRMLTKAGSSWYPIHVGVPCAKAKPRVWHDR
jgi:hypothetical protein